MRKVFFSPAPALAGLAVAVWLGVLSTGAADLVPAKTVPAPPPPLPPGATSLPRLREAALNAANNPDTPPPGRRLATPQRPVLPTTPTSGGLPPPANPVPRFAPATTSGMGLTFDSFIKTLEITNGAADAVFTFSVTNTSGGDITINSVNTSCGCTAAKLPQQPWLLHPGDHGEVGATMHVAGKYGTVTKTLTINSTMGSHVLTVRSVLPELNSQAGRAMGDRSRNLQIAAADRQAVFRGDCARCHVTPSVGKTGPELYVAACGVCHEAEHRASMVPVLAGRAGSFDQAYWDLWVRNGKVGSLMPAFDMKQGGPLNEDQIKSLVAYLANEFALTPPVGPAAFLAPAPAGAK